MANNPRNSPSQNHCLTDFSIEPTLFCLRYFQQFGFNASGSTVGDGACLAPRPCWVCTGNIKENKAVNCIRRNADDSVLSFQHGQNGFLRGYVEKERSSGNYRRTPINQV